jgi:nucleoside-diphosphate-sugar epimerase
MTQDKVTLGDPNPIRDLMYVDDHVNSYMKVIHCHYEKLEDIHAMNFCTGMGTSIELLANKIKSFLNYEGEIFWRIKTRPTEINALYGDYSLAKEVLGWTPKYSLDEGLKLTIGKIKDMI